MEIRSKVIEDECLWTFTHSELIDGVPSDIFLCTVCGKHSVESKESRNESV